MSIPDYNNKKIINVQVSFIDGDQQIIVPLDSDILEAYYDCDMEMYIIYQDDHFWSFPRESVTSFTVCYSKNVKGLEVIK